ncbi:MAG: hypothetical protein Q9202_004097 [Teloschistes flavicans]
MPGSLVANLPSSKPQFWAGQDLGLGVLSRIGDQTFSLLGIPEPPAGIRPATVLNAEYTSTRSIFTLAAGNATVKLEFLSPVSPSNYIRQSLPFSYLTISASNTGGASVQVYADIDESWTGQSGSTNANASVSGETAVFQLSVDGAITYAQNKDQALWGQVIFAARCSNTSHFTLQSGPPASVRGLFAANGTLSNSSPAYGTGDIVALAQNLGPVTSSASITYAIGYTRDAAINYLGNARASYYAATYKDSVAAVSHFLDDYADAAAEASSLDSDIDSKATNVAGTNYSDIVALSVRQAFGAADLTIPGDTLDTTDLMLFLKEISSDGNANTVDVIYPTFPIFYVMDPEYIRLVLEPVIQYLEMGRWPKAYTIHDIGSAYPNATGHDDGIAEQMPIEETGNILILAYAYTKAVNSATWANSHRQLLQGYADYLVTNGLNIAPQLSTDDGEGTIPNATNLAIKAAVGLTAFGATFDLQNYTAVGLNNANQLYNQSLGTDAEKTHFQRQYPQSLNANFTYSTVFNLYPDSLLGLNTFPQAAFDMQASFYPTQQAVNGVPLDSTVPYSKTDWSMFSGASSPGADSSTRDLLIDDLHAFISNGLNTVPFSDRWFVKDGPTDTGDPDLVGGYDSYRSRPTVGGHFAILAKALGAGSVNV